MSIPCDAQSLVTMARGLDQIPAGEQIPVLISLFCQLANQASGGGASLPSGAVIMWSGSIATIPAGFHLCDGTVGTPDLRNRFVVGARVDQGGVAKSDVDVFVGGLAQTGGLAEHAHFLTGFLNVVDASLNPTLAQVGGVGVYDSIASANIIGTGPGTEFASTIPPYFALAYIMKL